MSVYYDPAKHGLEIVGSIEEDDLDYEFNIFLVLKHTESGKVFYCDDSGCSCPTPFEGFSFNSPEDNNLNALTKANYSNFETAVNAFPANKAAALALLFKTWALL